MAAASDHRQSQERVIASSDALVHLGVDQPRGWSLYCVIQRVYADSARQRFSPDSWQAKLGFWCNTLILLRLINAG